MLKSREIPGPALSRLVFAVCVMAATIFNLACGKADTCQPGATTLPANVLKSLGDPWSGYAPFRTPGFIKDGRYSYSYEHELDQSVRACKLTSGEVDFIVTTLGQFLKQKPQGRVVAVIDRSIGADAVAFNTRKHAFLTSVEQLPRLVTELKKKGQKPVLAYTGNSPSEELVFKLSNTRDDFKLGDFELKEVDQSATALKMLDDGQADVAVLWEPDVTTARSKGYTIGLSSRDVPEAIVDVLIASDRIIKDNPDAVQAVVDALYLFRSQAVKDPNGFVEVIARDSEGALSVEQSRALLEGVYFYDARAADAYFNKKAYPLDETKAYEALLTIGGILSLNDPTVKPTREMIDGRFVRRAAER